MLMRTAAVRAADERENRDSLSGRMERNRDRRVGRHRGRRGKPLLRADAMKLESFELTSTTTVENAAWVWPENNGGRRERRGPCRLPAGRSGRRERS